MSNKTENRPATPGAKTEVNEVKRGDHAEVVRTTKGDEVNPRKREEDEAARIERERREKEQSRAENRRKAEEDLPELKDDAVLVVEKGKVVTLETNARTVTEGTEVKASDVQGGVEGARVLLKKRVVRVK